MIETSGHLPECSYTSGIWYSLDEDCICPALLACEQRMAATYLISDREQQEAEQRAYAAGVDAARDAVDAVPPIDQRVDDNGLISLVYEKGEILAAIDALREEQK